MRFFLAIVSFHFLLIGAVIAGTAWWGWHTYNSPGPLQADKIVMIPQGYGVSMIAQTLKKEGVIEQPLLFRLMSRATKQQSSMKAGEYAFGAHASMRDVLDLLESGKVVLRQVTLREGLTSYEITELLRSVEDLDGEISNIPAEGTLLPETYSYHKNESREAMLDRMRVAMTSAIDSLWPLRAEGLPFETKEEAIVLASIVEKETSLASERARVAGVFINRLRKEIPLQTDPSVIYAITAGKHQNDGKGPLGRRLLRRDLEIESPYNTYKHKGLPPGPIANPGRDALEAVLHPEENDYLYFVADGDGGHAFAKTLDEHNTNVAKWRKIRQENKN